MAETELKIKVTPEGVEETKDSLQGLTDSVETHSDAVKENTNSEVANILKREEARQIAQNFSNTINTLGQSIMAASRATSEQARAQELMKSGLQAGIGVISAFNPAIGAAAGAVVSLTQAVLEYNEQQERSRLQTQATSELFTSRYNVDLEATKQAVHGLVTELELQRIAIEAQRNGLVLTSELYANVAVAAQRLSERTGEDLATSLQKVTTALAQGNARALEDYGIRVGEATTQTEVLANATNDLENRFSISRRTIEQNREALIAQGASIEMVDEAIVNQSRNVASLDGHEMNRLRHIREMNEEFNTTHASLLQYENDMQQATEATLSHLNSLMDVIAARNTLANQSPAAGLTGLGGEDITQSIENEQRQRQQQRRSGGGGGGAAEEEWDPAEALRRAADQANQLGSVLTPILEEQNRLAEAQLAMQLDSARIASERAHNELLRTNELRMQTEEIIRQKDEQEKAAAIDKQRAEDALAATQTQNRMNMGLQGANTLLTQGMNLAQVAHKDGKKAAKEAMKEWLKNFAMQEVLKGGMALAEGIGMTITNPPAAGTKYAEAGYHFALAASAGGASAAIKGGGGGGGGGAAPKEQGGVKSSSGSSSGSAPAQNITINVEGTALLTQGQIGREVQNALVAYQQRY